MLTRAGYADVTVFERAERVGGVWHHNTYPGAACDVPSHLYEFSFAPNPLWSRRYAPQGEIRAYLEQVARQEGVSERIRTGVEVTAARWDENRCRWELQTDAGTHVADVLVSACGQLSVPAVPPLPGAKQFAGPIFHTARWRHDVELRGRRVAVIGTGASAIQVVPAIAPAVAQLDVYQRSPGWTLPKTDFAYSEATKRMFTRLPALQRLDRAFVFAFHELGALAMTSQPWLLPAFRALARRQINRAVHDPQLRRKVTPRDEVGCKRVMLTDEWYPTLSRSNVELIDERIQEITSTGIRAGGGERSAEVIVLATGFATHGFVAPMEITGGAGRRLAQEWAEVPRAYLGLTVPDFPNLFLLYGPNTNGGTGSVIYTLEAGINHVIAGLRALDRTGSNRIEVRRPAAERFDDELRTKLGETVWHSGCTNWYLDEHGNDPNQWPWTWSRYRRRTATIGSEDYELSASRSPVAALR